MLKKNPINEPPVVTIVTNQEGEDVSTLHTESSVSSVGSTSSGDSRSERQRKSVRDKNI